MELFLSLIHSSDKTQGVSVYDSPAPGLVQRSGERSKATEDVSLWSSGLQRKQTAIKP